jgi:hypothetical protein
MVRENNLMPIVIKYKSDMDEKESLDLEMDMIKCIGRKDKNLGPLTNLTDGGEGMSGYIMKEEQKEKITRELESVGIRMNKDRP